MKEKYEDTYRYSKEKRFSIKLFFKDNGYRFMWCWRNIKEAKGIKKFIFRIFLHSVSKKNGIEIPFSVILGGGVKILHPYNITINSNVKIGKNLTILKGATIG